MPPTPKKLSPRKLLIAAIGVATINYVAACKAPPTSGNLPGPDPMPDAGNVPPPPPDASTIPPTSGNLPAPQPVAPQPMPTKK